MAKRKLTSGNESSAKNISKSARKFHIPALLKTEQIEVVKPEIDTPCTDSKGSITSNNILFTCSDCGRSGTHHFGLEYRLVKTALLVEVGTQTGDESSGPEIQLEDSENLGDNGLLDRDCAKNRDTIPATSTSSTTTIIVSSDNEDDTSDDDECSDEDDCLGESGGEEEISSSKNDMILGLTDLSDDSSEDDETNGLQQQTSANLSRAKTNPTQELSSPGSSSDFDDYITEDIPEVCNETNEQSSCFRCKIKCCRVAKSSEQDLFEHVRIDHADRKFRCDVCPTAFEFKRSLAIHNRKHSEAKSFECDQCGKCFNWKRSLKNHKIIHNEQRIISCWVKNCGLSMSRENLEEHIKTAHPEYKHKCSICPMAFKLKNGLIIHKRVHTGDKSY
eukprot:sb/3465532/